MDCKTARLLLPFAGPAPGELPPAEADDLEAHLDSCPDCAAGARAERALDEQLGTAMRAVEVPDRLKARILAGLAEQRRDERRRRWGRKLRVAVPAAAVLLVAVSLWAFGSPFKANVNPHQAFEDMKEAGIASLGPRDVEERFARMGVTTKVPAELNYAYLSDYALAELPGKPGKVVPRLTFTHGGGKEQRVIVYVLSARDFNLRSLANPPEFDPGYLYQLHVDTRDPAYGYFYFHTGRNYDWLRSSDGN